jgi:phosphohistidine phosphatase
MDLIIWRHAEAADPLEGQQDLERALTARGEKQAARMARWLDARLPQATRILCSPALRCEQTVLPLGRKYKCRDELAPDASSSQLLHAAGWADARHPVLVVGHQPVLGETIAGLLGLKQGICQVRKGAVWWIRTRERDGHQQSTVVAVQSPDTL